MGRRGSADCVACKSKRHAQWSGVGEMRYEVGRYHQTQKERGSQSHLKRRSPRRPSSAVGPRRGQLRRKLRCVSLLRAAPPPVTGTAPRPALPKLLLSDHGGESKASYTNHNFHLMPQQPTSSHLLCPSARLCHPHVASDTKASKSNEEDNDAEEISR